MVLTWEKQMEKGMKIIYSACRKNLDWANCERCPFRVYCDILEKKTGDTPDMWELKEVTK